MQRIEDADWQNKKENRTIVTPYAFGVAPSLVGTPLATPSRRGLAILLDLFFVSMLAKLNALVLNGVLAIVFLVAAVKLRKRNGNKTTGALLLVAASFLLIFLLVGLWATNFDLEFTVGDTEESSLNVNVDARGLTLATVSLVYATKIESMKEKIHQGECVPSYVCWGSLADEFAADLAKIESSTDEAQTLFDVLVDTARPQLAAGEADSLRARMLASYQRQQTVEPVSEQIEKTSPTPVEKNDGNKQSVNSVVAWAKGIAADLGIGFGWAAFYFSVFTAWWHGQTLGKYLLKIKIVKLNGDNLTLWESFGRYGGYSAGFATGLLGFLQIFWDANRQGIQDKIAETLVIDLRQVKHAANPQSGKDAPHEKPDVAQ